MQVAPTSLHQPTSSGREAGPCGHASENELQKDLTMEELIKKREELQNELSMLDKDIQRREKAAGNLQRDAFKSKRKLFKSRSFLGAHGGGGLNMKECTGVQAELTRAITMINNIALRSDQCARIGIASPAVLYVEKGTLIATRYGAWLRRTRRRGPVIGALVATASLIHLSAYAFAEQVVMYEGQKELVILRRNSTSNFFHLAVVLCLWFHLLQCVNRKMVFMLVQYFEIIAIVGCQVGSIVAYEYNIRMTFGRADLYDAEWQVWNVLVASLAYFPSSVFIALVDSLFVAKHHWNIAIVAALLLLHLFNFFRERFYGRCWSARQIIVFGREVGTAKSWFCTNQLQISMILLKMLTTYLMGYPWCVIRADFLRAHSSSDMTPGVDESSVAPERDLEAGLQDLVLAANEAVQDADLDEPEVLGA